MPDGKMIAAALTLLLLGLCSAYAQRPDEPYLSKCGRTGQALSPIPYWSQTLEGVPQLVAAPGPDSGRIVYLVYGVLADDVTTEESGVAYSITLDVAKAKTAKRLKVIFWGKPQPANGYVRFTGFYALTQRAGTPSEVVLRQLDTFDIVSSGRYCIGEATTMARAVRNPPQVATTPGLPWCGTRRDRRIPIARWEPHLSIHEPVEHFLHLPPMGDGRIVYISIDKNEQCPDDPDHLFTVSRPVDVDHVSGAGGLAVNLRGNFAPHGGRCRLQGFYMNQPVFGEHQGWTETYFAPIDEGRIEASGRYCLERQVMQ